MNPLADGTATVFPGVKVGMMGRSLMPNEKDRLERVEGPVKVDREQVVLRGGHRQA